VSRPSQFGGEVRLRTPCPGLIREGGRITGVRLGGPDLACVAVPLHASGRWCSLRARHRPRGSNLKYDLIWIAEEWGIECTDFNFETCLITALSR
jgi:hypothetical protein